MNGRRKGLRGFLVLLTGVLLGVGLSMPVLRTQSGTADKPTPPPPHITPAPPPSSMPGPLPAGSAEETLPTPAESGGQEEPADPGPGPEAEAEALLRAFLEEQPGRWDLCFLALPEGEPVLCTRDREPMVSASLIKLYIMGAVYERTERGELDPEAVRAPLEAMITVSDNASANRLIRLLGGGDEEAGMAAVNDWCLRQSFGETRLNRLMLADNGLQNNTSARDCALLLRAIYRGECVSPEASREMEALLLGQKLNDRLPRDLPAGTPVGHKTGDLIGLCRADVGIVYSPGGDYILCILGDARGSEAAETDAMAELSRQIYGLMNPD